MNEYLVLLTVDYGPPPPAVRIRARNKEHATLIAGHALGNRTELENVLAIEVKLMRRG